MYIQPHKSRRNFTCHCGERSSERSEEARQAFLQAIVANANRVLELARQAQGQLPEEDRKRRGIVEAAELLRQLLLQDVERKDDGGDLKEGVGHDRIPSVHDPEIRHGCKSSSVRLYIFARCQGSSCAWPPYPLSGSSPFLNGAEIGDLFKNISYI